MPAQLAKYLPCEVESLCSILAGVTLRASRICGRKICLYFENNISKYNKFVFSGRIILRMIAELLKNAPVFLKH